MKSFYQKMNFMLCFGIIGVVSNYSIALNENNDSIKSELMEKLRSSKNMSSNDFNNEVSVKENVGNKAVLIDEFNQKNKNRLTNEQKKDLYQIIQKKDFTNGKDWYIIGENEIGRSKLETELKRSNLSITFWQNYNCETCVKLFDVYKVYKHRIKYEDSFRNINLPISILPVVIKSNPQTYEHAAIFNSILQKGEDEFNKLNSQFLKLSLKEKLKVNYSPEDFNTTFFIEKTFNKEKVKDLPMIRIGRFIITSETIRRLSESDLIDLIKYLSALAVLDSQNQISLGK